ncbi:MAG TPA: hypothetical protein VFO55_04640 [Gemmatimonadaceae bacterium]|nr:hypothetical protein [Gemmatimonadaceae bacterium]
MAEAIAPPEKYPLVQANAGGVIGGSVRSFLFVALTIGVMWTALRGRLGAAATAGLLVALAAADLWSVERGYFRFSPPARELYAADPTVEYLQRLEEPGRVMSVALTGQGAPTRYYMGMRSSGIACAP